jgi:hypothetical protein
MRKVHGGKREGAGRKPQPDPALLDPNQRPGPVPGIDRGCYARIIEALNRPKEKGDSYEIQQWRKFSEAQDLRLSFETRKYLYDKRDGKAIQPVDVDATLESSVMIHLGKLMPKEFRDDSDISPRRSVPK